MTETNGAVHRPPDIPFDQVEAGVLGACREATVRRQELLPLLAATVGVAPSEVFYAWTLRRQWLLEHCGQHGRLGDTGWGFFFHGAECDLSHDDGRVLRYDFGPGGRVDTFTSWGVLQFLTTSAAPWPEFPELKTRLARRLPSGGSVGDTRAMDAVWDRLTARGAFQPAAPDLVAFQARHTTVGPDGIRYTRFPPGTPESVMIDCSVAHRPVLSPVGLRLLNDYALGQPAGVHQ
jgi:hypothetical protein